MEETPFVSIATSFVELLDPRLEGRCEHQLIEIIIVAICAVIAEAENWAEIAVLGKSKEQWLKHFPALKHEIC